MAHMASLDFKSAGELQVILGDQLRRLRLTRNQDQRTVAEKAGISKRALGNLEAGKGSTVETLLRTLKALDALDRLEMIAPEPTVNPVALLKLGRLPQRIRRPRVHPGETQ